MRFHSRAKSAPRFSRPLNQLRGARPSMPPEHSPHQAASKGTSARSAAMPSDIRRAGEAVGGSSSRVRSAVLKDSRVFREAGMGAV